MYIAVLSAVRKLNGGAFCFAPAGQRSFLVVVRRYGMGAAQPPWEKAITHSSDDSKGREQKSGSGR